MDVSDVLRDRMHEPAGLQQMAALSTLAHGALLAAIVFAPADWFGRTAEAPRTVMTITLNSGTPGPDSGGLTSIGGRPVQEVTPPDAPREALAAPAAKAPVMTVPEANARPSRAASASVKQAPDEARGRRPTRGAEASEGTAVAVTGVRGQGFGLSTGGATGLGYSLDVDFCCPDYLALMVQKIRGNWNAQAETAGHVVVRFVIQRSGLLAESRVEEPSGVFALDQNALRAVVGTRQLAPLPEAFSNPTLTVHLTFEYTR